MPLICVRVFWCCVFFVNYVVKLSESEKALYEVLVTVIVGITLEKMKCIPGIKQNPII